MIIPKRNYLVYFYSYFVSNLILIFINVMLPIYFFNILNVNRIELAIIQFATYSILFTKPIISIYFDIVRSKRRVFLIISSIGTLISFIFFTLYINILTIFGIFLSINFLCVSVSDVVIDKMIVDYSPDEKTKDRTARYIFLGSMSGAIFPTLISFLIFTDLYSIPTWHLFFIILSFAIIPMIFMSCLLKVPFDSDKKEIDTIDNDIDKKSIVLLCICAFFTYGEKIYNYPLEPWLVERWGEQYFSLLLLILMIMILLNALGLVIASIISNRYNRKKLLADSCFLYGLLMIIAPFTDKITFFIIFGIMQIFSGLIIVNLFSLMVKHSHKKVWLFQLLTTFILLARVLLVPLGTYLSAFIPTELIIVIAGILVLLAVIPTIFIKYEKEQLSMKSEI
ncbi:MAG: MFS transporter [Candidatus Hodarchaeota archaeon]